MEGWKVGEEERELGWVMERRGGKKKGGKVVCLDVKILTNSIENNVKNMKMNSYVLLQKYKEQ